MSKDEQIGKRIAKRVMREFLSNSDRRDDIKEHGLHEVENYRQGLYVRKHVNIYCRQLAAALSGLK
jgi:hypothetical protein